MTQPRWMHRQGVDGPGPGGPQPGEVYRVDTGLLSICDAKSGEMRPVVVLTVNAPLARVFVCARTTQRADGSGVFHASDDELGLNKDGWFRRQWYQSVDLRQFRQPLVERLGSLDEEALADVEREVS